MQLIAACCICTPFCPQPQNLAFGLALSNPSSPPPPAGSSESLSGALELARKRELPPYLERKLALLATKAPEYDPNLEGVPSCRRGAGEGGGKGEGGRKGG